MFYVDRLLTFRSLLIAARPGMGKTTLALCLADAFRTASGKDALIFMPTVRPCAPWTRKADVTLLPESSPAHVCAQITERTGLIVLDNYDLLLLGAATLPALLSALVPRGVSAVVTATIPRVPLECRGDKHPCPADLGCGERLLSVFDAVACLYTDAYYTARTGAPERGEIRLYPRGGGVPDCLDIRCDFTESLISDA